MRGARTAAGLDAWAPAELAHISLLGFQWLAVMCNAIELGCQWPAQLAVGGTAILSKKEGNITDPMAYRM
eukprot:2213459-Alexandrium_andersonii.AAC.1